MPLKLIGAGLGRTGTLSLKAALEAIGYGPCYHMSEVLTRPGSQEPWVKAADGQPDWEEIFEGYQSCVDYPACNYWRELAATYPHAKVLLSVRDPEKWFESTQETIFSTGLEATLLASPMKEFFEKTTWRDFGDHIHDRAFMVEAFKAHVAEVQNTIPKERLLVFEAKQGWKPLCDFLGVPVPDTPFPHVNSRDELREILDAPGADNEGGTADMEQMREAIAERLRKLHDNT